MAERWDTWPTPIKSSKHVGQSLEWVRWKTGRKALLTLAIGVNSTVVSADPDLKAEEAIEMLRGELANIEELLRYQQQKKKAHAIKIRLGPR